MKKFGTMAVIITLAILFLPIQSVFAQEGQENTVFNRHVGPYVEGTVGKTLVWIPDIFGDDLTTGGFFGYGFTAAGGYMFKHWIGAEAGYLYIKPEFQGETVEGHLYGFFVTSRFNIPIKDRFSFTFKLGATTMAANSDRVDTEIAPFGGLGIGYALTDKIDLRFGFQGPSVLFWGVGVLGGGITYHF